MRLFKLSGFLLAALTVSQSLVFAQPDPSALVKVAPAASYRAVEIKVPAGQVLQRRQLCPDGLHAYLVDQNGVSNWQEVIWSPENEYRQIVRTVDGKQLRAVSESGQSSYYEWALVTKGKLKQAVPSRVFNGAYSTRWIANDGTIVINYGEDAFREISIGVWNFNKPQSEVFLEDPERLPTNVVSISPNGRFIAGLNYTPTNANSRSLVWWRHIFFDTWICHKIPKKYPNAIVECINDIGIVGGGYFQSWGDWSAFRYNITTGSFDNLGPGVVRAVHPFRNIAVGESPDPLGNPKATLWNASGKKMDLASVTIMSESNVDFSFAYMIGRKGEIVVSSTDLPLTRYFMLIPQ